MDSGSIFYLLSSFLMIGLGLRAKFSTQNDGWNQLRKYWLALVLIGLISLVLKVLKLAYL